MRSWVQSSHNPYLFLLPSGVSNTFLRVSVETSSSLSLASSGFGAASDMALVTPHCFFFWPSMLGVDERYGEAARNFGGAASSAQAVAVGG